MAGPQRCALAGQPCTSSTDCCKGAAYLASRCQQLAQKRIQELAGHTSLSTTLRYLHLSPSAREQAIALLDRRDDQREVYGNLTATNREEVCK